MFSPNSKKAIFVTYFLFVLILLYNSQTLGQINPVNFTRILSQNGLSQNTVHCILQDNKGFMWFATEDGLDKYDGYNFTVYKNIAHDESSLSDNFIWTIYQDRDGNMWVGTNSGGLCEFNIKKEKFTTYKNAPGDINSLTLNNVRAICEDNEGYLWVGTEGGLDRFDVKKKIFVHYKHDPANPNSLSNNVVLSLFVDDNDNIWIGSNGGLDKFNRKDNIFHHYTFNSGNVNSIGNNIVLSIYQDRTGYLWVGTLNGLVRFDKNSGKFHRYVTNPLESRGTNINRINSIVEDKTGNIWAGTGAGLLHLKEKGKQLYSNESSILEPAALSTNNVLSVYEDNSGLVWIGTAEDGIVKYDRERAKFITYKHNPSNPNSLSHNTVRAIFQDEDGTLWVGTLGGGLDRLNPDGVKFFHYRNKPENKFSLSDNSISAIYKDSFGYLWVGTWGHGLNRTVLRYKGSIPYKLKFIHYLNAQSNVQQVTNNIIQAIYEDSNKRLWVGTEIGLDLYDRKTNSFINFVHNPANPYSISSNQVQSCILEDRNGNLWIGTWNGLNMLSADQIKDAITKPSSVKFKHFEFRPNKASSLSDDRVISAYQDTDDNLWFGTYGGGLNELPKTQQNSPSPEFIHFTVKNGLPSNIIYTIQSDKKGNIWLSTDNGLSVFNPLKKTFRNYDASDGLQGNQFYWGASFKGKNGELFFGGTDGLSAFFPSELKDNKHVPPVYITNFQIFNKPVDIDTKNSPLKNAIVFTKDIELPYSSNVFSFEFVALDYTAPHKNQYAYMMEGFDKSWIYSGHRHFVTYTNLDPGNYVFKVRGSNNDGVWNNRGAEIMIRVLPPFWRTWWFILAGVILIGGIVASIIYFRVRHLLEIERFRTKLAADLHDNIGSSLTEISILSEVISHKLKSENEEIKKNLNMISNSSRSLIDSMSDIVWLVNPRRDSLYDLILRLRDTYSELSSYTSISFKSENIKALEKVSLSMEYRQHLYLIFKEAINNCITHSSCSEISLDASVKGSKLQMVLKDNGKGFDTEIASRGNGLVNMKNRAKMIGGNLDIQSRPGEGTIIQFEGNIL